MNEIRAPWWVEVEDPQSFVIPAGCPMRIEDKDDPTNCREFRSSIAETNRNIELIVGTRIFIDGRWTQPALEAGGRLHSINEVMSAPVYTSARISESPLVYQKDKKGRWRSGVPGSVAEVTPKAMIGAEVVFAPKQAQEEEDD